MKTPRQLVFGLDEKPGSYATMLVSLLVAFAILFGGMFWTYRIGLQANNLDHQASHAQEAVQDLHRTLAHKSTKV